MRGSLVLLAPRRCRAALVVGCLAACVESPDIYGRLLPAWQVTALGAALDSRLGLLAVSVPVDAQDLSVAAASDLQSVLPVVAERFQRETGHAVRLTFGSSGNLFSQIQNGAPFDLFFSADIDYPQRLEQAGLAQPGTVQEYATGRIVLWTRRDSGIDIAGGLQVLTDPRVRRIALANPAHAPYGRAAVAALRQAQVYEAVRGKFALGENISQAAQFVQTGNAEVGILALSVALAPAARSSGRYVEIPVASYPPLVQAAVVLSRSRNQEAARQFLDFLRRPDIVSLLQESGFAPPRGTLRPSRQDTNQ